MSTDKCRETKCKHYLTKGQGLGGLDLKEANGRCEITGKIIHRMKECPKLSTLNSQLSTK